MRELHDIVECLCDADGSARVVTFEHCSWNGVEELITGLRTSFERYTATYTDEEVATNPSPASVVSSAQEKGIGHLVFDTGVGLMKHLQIWVLSENGERPLVEALFFPEDIDKKDLREAFLKWQAECVLGLRQSAIMQGMKTGLGQLGILGQSPLCSWCRVSLRRMPNTTLQPTSGA